MAIDDEQRGRARCKRREGGRRQLRHQSVLSAHLTPRPDRNQLFQSRAAGAGSGRVEPPEDYYSSRLRSQFPSPASSQSVHLTYERRPTTLPPLNHQATTGTSSSYTTTNIHPHPPPTPPRHPRPHNHPAAAAAAAAAATSARQPHPPPARWDDREDVPVFRDIVEYRRYKQKKERARLQSPPSPPQAEDFALPSLANQGAMINTKQPKHGKRNKKTKAPAPARRVVYYSSDDEYEDDKVPRASDIFASIERKEQKKRMKEREEEMDAGYEETYNLRENPFGSKARRRRDDGDDNEYDDGHCGGRGGPRPIRV